MSLISGALSLSLPPSGAVALTRALGPVVWVEDVTQMSFAGCLGGSKQPRSKNASIASCFLARLTFHLHSAIRFQCESHRILTAFLKGGPDLSVNELRLCQVDGLGGPKRPSASSSCATALTGEVATAGHELSTRVPQFNNNKVEKKNSVNN